LYRFSEDLFALDINRIYWVQDTAEGIILTSENILGWSKDQSEKTL